MTTEHIAMSAEHPPSQMWLRRRKLTVIAFSFQYSLMGLEYGILVANLWIYINQSVPTDQPKAFYAAIMVCYLLSNGLLSLPVAKYADRSRNIRVIFFSCNTVKIIGNCMYILNISPWILVVSRLISGCGNACSSVAYGELARCFKADEIMSKISALNVWFNAGFMFAPAINAMFTSVIIRLGNLHITFANISGIYIAILYVVAEVTTFFMIHDLSKEYDMKCNDKAETELIELTREAGIKGTDDSYLLLTEKGGGANESSPPLTDKSGGTDEISPPLTKNGGGKNTFSPPLAETSGCIYETLSCLTEDGEGADLYLPPLTEKSEYIYETLPLLTEKDGTYESSPLLTEKSEGTDETSPPSTVNGGVTKRLLTNVDSCLLISLAFFENYMLSSFHVWKSILIIDTLKWSVTALYVFLYGMGLFSILPGIVVMFKQFSSKQFVIYSIVGIIAYAGIQLIFFVLTIYNGNTVLNIFLVVIMATLYSFTLIIKSTLLAGIFTKLVSTKYQSFAQSIRFLAGVIGVACGFLSAPFVYGWLKIVGPVYFCVFILFSILLIIRRKSLINPRVVI